MEQRNLRLLENPVDRLARTIEALLVIAPAALSVQELATAGVVGDDRAVRIQQVSIAAIPLAPVHRDEPELHVHPVLVLAHDRAQELARTRLRSALAARVIGRDALLHGAPLRDVAPGPLRDRRPEADDRKDRQHDEGDRQEDAQPPAAGGKNTTRSASRGISEKSRTMVASRRVPSAVGTAAHMPRSS